jgi:EAL domain-containing protein (putative c-di-GMP-specific phosphodiesterase class I)
MGTIKAALVAEAREFISLYELLETLQKIDQCTLREAAQYLNRELEKGAPDTPQFVQFSPESGICDIHFTDHTHESLLFSVVNDGKYADKQRTWEVDDDGIPF